jgi:hypothetical protein
MTDYNAMTTEEIENEILKEQTSLNSEMDNLGVIQETITDYKSKLIMLEDKKFKAREVIRRTKQVIDNLQNVFKWRSIRRDKGL